MRCLIFSLLLITSSAQADGFSLREPAELPIVSDDNRAIVTIDENGRVELGPDITLDQASLSFWKAIQQTHPRFCKP